MSGLIWFSCITELTGSEKSTIASVLEFKLNKERKLTYLLTYLIGIIFAMASIKT